MDTPLFPFIPRSDARPTTLLEQEGRHAYNEAPVRPTAKPVDARFSLALWLLAKGFTPAGVRNEYGVAVYSFPPEARRVLSEYHAAKTVLQDLIDNLRK